MLISTTIWSVKLHQCSDKAEEVREGVDDVRNQLFWKPFI